MGIGLEGDKAVSGGARNSYGDREGLSGKLGRAVLFGTGKGPVWPRSPRFLDPRGGWSAGAF